jgi:U3 small nucleolar RNA-associated protein 20
MDRMTSVVVTASRLAIRQQAGNILVHFLLYYPLGPKRIDHHLRQSLANISYVHTEGRTSAISVVHRIVLHIPVPVLDEKAALLFLPLALRVANDEDKVKHVLHLLFQPLFFC